MTAEADCQLTGLGLAGSGFKDSNGLDEPPKSHLRAGLDELGLDVVDELTRDFLVPLLSEQEADRMVAWNWGVSL